MAGSVLSPPDANTTLATVPACGADMAASIFIALSDRRGRSPGPGVAVGRNWRRRDLHRYPHCGVLQRHTTCLSRTPGLPVLVRSNVGPASTRQHLQTSTSGIRRGVPGGADACQNGTRRQQWSGGGQLCEPPNWNVLPAMSVRQRSIEKQSGLCNAPANSGMRYDQSRRCSMPF
jgi:hypothetical protein